MWGVLQFGVWPYAQPAYSTAVAAAADRALGVIEAGQRVTRVAGQGRYIHVFSDLSEGTDAATSYDANVLHFYVVLFVSVFLVFPGLGLRRRIALLVSAVAALFVFHTAVVLVNVEHMYAVGMERVSARNYTEAERAAWTWMHANADFLAVQLLPALALVMLVFVYGGFGRSPRGQSEAASPAGRPRRRPLGRWAGIAGLALVAGGLATAATLHTGKISARQAEKECMLGYRMLEERRHPEAAALFDSALARKPDFPEAIDGRGLTRMLRNDIPGAIADFRTVLEKDPDHAAARLHLGNALYGQLDFAGAVEQYQMALSRDPSRKEGWLNLAASLKKLGRRAEAEAALHRLLEFDPDHRQALFELSASMIASSRACGALPHLRRLERLGTEPAREALIRSTIADLERSCAPEGEATRSTP